MLGNSFEIYYPNGKIRDVISTVIDSLDNDKKLHIVMIVAGGWHVCLAQKYMESNHAAGLVFGYFDEVILYQRKIEGTWQPIREI